MQELDKIQNSIDVAEARYERLVLLVGGADTGKSTILRAIANIHRVPVTNVSLQLSEALLEVPAHQRPRQVKGRMESIVGMDKLLLVLDNLEVLFAKELKQDPLRLLKSLSKDRVVVAAWPGKVEGEKLIHAKPGHSEFHSYDLLDLLWVETAGRAAIDPHNVL
jgi:hypothetical protein